MLSTPCYVVSDAHLGATTARAEREMLAFLEHVRHTGGSLVINGDLFDFWFEWRTVIPRPAFRVLGALYALTDRAIPVVWVAGNHDCWGGEILRRDVGVWYQLEPWEGEIGGWRTRVDHGDGLREQEDRRYRRIRPILRNGLAIRAFRALHPDLATRIAIATSDTSRGHRTIDEGEALRAIALATLAARGDLDLIVFGHSHIATVERTEHGVFANAGAWVARPTYLVVTPDRISLREWSGSLSTKGVELDAVDRSPEKATSHTDESFG